VRYTSKGEIVYAVCLQWPGSELILGTPKSAKETKVTLVGYKHPLEWRYVKGDLHVDVPRLSIDQVSCKHAHVFRLTEVK
jgi:hypothetical protein